MLALESFFCLQSVVDKVVVMQHAIRTTGASGDGRSSSKASGPATAAQLGRYAGLLAGQGMLEVALRYLGDSQDEALLLLRDQIYRGMITPPADVPAPPNLFAAAPAAAAAATKSPSRMANSLATMAARPGSTGGSGGLRPGTRPAYPSGAQPSGPGYQQPVNAAGYQQPVNAAGYQQPVNAAGYQQPVSAASYQQPVTAQPNIFTPAPTNAATPPPPSGTAMPPPAAATTRHPPLSVLGTGRVSCAGWNDPPPRKERSKTVSGRRG